MKTRLVETPLKGLVVVEIDCFQDERGFLIETWHKHDFQKVGLDITFVQEVHSGSKSKVLRGLHYQIKPAARLVRCLTGSAFTVAVDLRVKSPTFGKWFSIELTSENKKQLYVPTGFALGFATLSNFVELLYKFTNFYDPFSQGIILWNDKDLAIKWPYNDPVVSKRDANGMIFSQYKKNPAFQ